MKDSGAYEVLSVASKELSGTGRVDGEGGKLSVYILTCECVFREEGSCVCVHAKGVWHVFMYEKDTCEEMCVLGGG